MHYFLNLQVQLPTLRTAGAKKKCTCKCDTIDTCPSQRAMSTDMKMPY